MLMWLPPPGQVEAHLSRALSVPVVRRHARGPADAPDGFHYGPAVRIVSGNFVTGKRRGVVDGVDFGATGSGERCFPDMAPIWIRAAASTMSALCR